MEGFLTSPVNQWDIVFILCVWAIIELKSYQPKAKKKYHFLLVDGLFFITITAPYLLLRDENGNVDTSEYILGLGIAFGITMGILFLIAKLKKIR